MLLAPWLAAPASCGAQRESGGTGRVEPGEWGGDRVRLTVTERGAEVEFDCAHGSLAAPLVVDKKGRFEIAGRFVREHGGPIRLGERPDEQPARYEGQVDGPRMALTVRLQDRTLGPFELGLGKPARLHKCL